MSPAAKKTAPAKKTAAAKPTADTSNELEALRTANAKQLRAQLADKPPTDSADASELERLGKFIAAAYPTEARTDESPVDVAVRLLDRSRAIAPGGVDPASGQPTAAPAAVDEGGPALVDYTLTAEDTAAGATLTDVAKARKVNPGRLLAVNAAILDAEAQARGLAHSDNGRIIFPGTVIRVPPGDS